MYGTSLLSAPVGMRDAPRLLVNRSLPSILLALVPAFVLLACADPPPPRSPEPATLSTAGVRATCPLGVRNAHVVYRETHSGASLLFSAAPDSLAELRARVANGASMHGQGAKVGEGHRGVHGEGQGRHGLSPSSLPPSHAGYEDTPDGARITFTPERPDDVDRLRESIKERADRLMRRCPDDSQDPELRAL